MWCLLLPLYLILQTRVMQDATPETLFDSHIPLAIHLANRWCKRYYNLHPDDCKQIALMALWRGATRYNSALNTQFNTYAWVIIRRALSHYAKGEFNYYGQHNDMPIDVFESLTALPTISLIEQSEDHAQRQGRIKALLDLLTPAQQSVVKALLSTEGNATKAARECGISKQRVCEVLAVVRRKYYKAQLADHATAISAIEACFEL